MIIGLKKGGEESQVRADVMVTKGNGVESEKDGEGDEAASLQAQGLAGGGVVPDGRRQKGQCPAIKRDILSGSEEDDEEE